MADKPKASTRKWPQETICEECGKWIDHDTAMWADDGSSYCPTCRTLDIDPFVRTAASEALQ